MLYEKACLVDRERTAGMCVSKEHQSSLSLATTLIDGHRELRTDIHSGYNAATSLQLKKHALLSSWGQVGCLRLLLGVFPQLLSRATLNEVLSLCLQRELTSSGDAPNETLLWKEEGLCCAPGMPCCSACSLLSACPASAVLKSWGEPPTFCGSDRTGRVSARDKSCCHVSKLTGWCQDE